VKRINQLVKPMWQKDLKARIKVSLADVIQKGYALVNEITSDYGFEGVNSVIGTATIIIATILE
jgi:hypothetical protein